MYSVNKTSEFKTYTLMCKDTSIVEFSIVGDTISNCVLCTNDNKLLPMQLNYLNGQTLSNWLRSRRFDTTRSNARLILKLLKLGTSSDILPVIFNKGLSLTDCYWLKEHNSNSTFNDVSLYRRSEVDSIAVTSLSGAIHELPRIENPEITNIGSFNKAWRKVDGEWWLFKTGSDLNNYAELFTYYLGQAMGMNMAEYKVIDGHVCTKNFTDESTMLEHYASLVYMFDVKDYDDEIALNNFTSIGLGEQYCDILLLDGIVCNPDRHEFNLGVLRDSNTGTIISMAPNFDNNLSLGSSTTSGKPSMFLLDCYIDSIGLQQHQLKYIQQLSFELLQCIDNRVKEELNINIDTSVQLEYLRTVVSRLRCIQ